MRTCGPMSDTTCCMWVKLHYAVTIRTHCLPCQSQRVAHHLSCFSPISHLLQEGAGRAVMTAEVEIIFDNSDKRFPVS